MYSSRSKTDLMIEVWEKLDCESVGAAEILAVERAVLERFGQSAVESPMRIARLLANEGAELRHSEIMQLFIERQAETRYDAILRNIIDLKDLKSALRTIRDLENVRRKFSAENDKEGLRLLREAAIRRKTEALERSNIKSTPAGLRRENKEIAEWLTIWLQSPELFENWVALRQRSKEFMDSFGAATT